MARTAERTLTVAHDPHDDVDTLNRLRRLHARPFGQVVCEPAPTGGASGLARSILAALGKDPDLGPRRDPLWRLVDVHLRAERTRTLVVLRAHTLTYAPLRRLADITDAAGIHLWLVVHTERLPGPVAQLLEGLAHDTSDLERCNTCPTSPTTTLASCPPAPDRASRTSMRSASTSSTAVLAS